MEDGAVEYRLDEGHRLDRRQLERHHAGHPLHHPSLDPVIMPRQKRSRCRNCPDEQKPTDLIQPKVMAAKLSGDLITQAGESERLWKHVLFGTSTCIGMINGYADLGLPGDPRPRIQELIRQLQTAIQTIEDRYELSVDPDSQE